MKSLDELPDFFFHTLFTDIDDTLTDNGELGPQAYQALWDLKKSHIRVIPVTGRPAGWCEMIARLWPVDAVVGENGGFYFRYHNHQMKRGWLVSPQVMNENRLKLEIVKDEILKKIPGAAVASDQFCRLMDLAIDFCEDVPALPLSEVQKIVKIFEKHGAQAKVSSIHVNGWFGIYNKLSACKELFIKEYHSELDKEKDHVVFCGDSPNDEPMFSYFPYSFGVANIKKFMDQLKFPPQFISSFNGGKGFAQIAQTLIKKTSQNTK